MGALANAHDEKVEMMQGTDPDAVSADVLARWLGLSPKEVYDLMRAGVLKRGAGRLFPLEENVRRYVEHLRQATDGPHKARDRRR